MEGFWSKVIPIIIVFFLGFTLKKIKLFSSDTADTLLKLSFYVTLPSLTFLSGATAELNLKFIFLPVIAILTMLLISLISVPIANLFKMPRATHGSFQLLLSYLHDRWYSDHEYRIYSTICTGSFR